ncbi:sterol desaturase/sphingolipid hydroxylase (fatty acid hydroxylase superfamily) [Herbaspirillum sp. Sphag1AN]|uniref:sterol desaturase family protein n=1 Tax=unclassified Herbaspirillum TaxID=2624150 RepID=UPI001615FB6A|nr:MULTISPECIES: sterol desaturase family protein [unclassified Herbaspirillum]MBB3210813.1 sterol desaturase/sphingolipid hydroxylase (fatty acid hydroxylase superfamily) [Herbaspirillum sp. Sphag1AN]MBB3244443.1 sterol desaturase/sphingolipid hydroxylase (fatty acid hydroxylase superfamily) [Herbaspirillum sp. Sphag64]
MEKIIVYIIPVFFILMCVEFAYGYFTRRNTYRLSDTISSLNQGLISQLVALVTQLFQIGVYAMVYKRVALFPNLAFWGTALGWVASIVLFDFFDYWLHRFGHENALGWAAHAVHHQSQEFNFSTALRQESAVAFIGCVFYLPMAVMGIDPEQFGIAGLIVLVYQFWIHTEHIGKLGWFDRVFSSPSNHRVHHAVNDQYLDKNYGGMLVIWDRMFGTFAEEKEPCVYGTRTRLDSWNPVWAVVSGYWQIAKTASTLPRWQDKLRVWFKHPGWYPEGVTASGPGFDLQQAEQRYDPPVSTHARFFAVVQFVLLMVATAGCLWVADDMSYWSLAGVCALLLAAFWALGALLEGRTSWLGLLLVDAVVSMGLYGIIAATGGLHV